MSEAQNGHQSKVVEESQQHLVWSTNQTILGAPLLNDVTYEMFLAIVCRQNGNLICWIAK